MFPWADIKSRLLLTMKILASMNSLLRASDKRVTEVPSYLQVFSGTSIVTYSSIVMMLERFDWQGTRVLSTSMR